MRSAESSLQVVVMLLLLALGSVAQETTSALVARLGGEDLSARTPAYQQLRTRLGPELAAELRKRLPDFDAQAQSLGLYLSQSLPEPQRGETLRSFLSGKPSLLRLGAAAYLARMGDRNLARHIVACLENPGPDPSFSLMLGRLLGTEEEAVLGVICRKIRADLSLGELGTALRIMAQARFEPARARASDLVAAEGLDADRRARLAAFLCVMAEPGAKTVLVESLPAATNWTQVYFILDQAKTLDKEVLDVVLKRAGELRGYELRYAIQLLVKHDHRPAAQQMRAWLEGDDAEAVKAALNGLVSMGEDIPREKLSKLISSKLDEICVTAADTLRRLDDDSGLDRVIAIAEKSGSSSLDAVTALSKFRDRRAVPPLIRLLESGNSAVRQQAFMGLRQLFQALFPYRSFDFEATGFPAASTLETRREAIALIESWWQAHAKAE